MKGKIRQSTRNIPFAFVTADLPDSYSAILDQQHSTIYASKQLDVQSGPQRPHVTRHVYASSFMEIPRFQCFRIKSSRAPESGANFATLIER